MLLLRRVFDLIIDLITRPFSTVILLLRRVYDARTSQSVGQRLSQTNLLSMFGNTRVSCVIAAKMILSKFRLIKINSSIDLQERVEYVHMKGLGDKGHVELAISKPKGKLVGYFFVKKGSFQRRRM